MKKLLVMLDYLADTHAHNIVELKAYPIKNAEAQIHVDSRCDHLAKEILFLAGMKKRLLRRRRHMLLLWICVGLLLISLPAVAGAFYLLGRVHEGNEWVTVDEHQFCERLGAGVPKVNFE